MHPLHEFLASHGGMLLAGSTALMLIGALAVALARAPIHAQRLSEISIVAVIAWLALACAPIPRLLSPKTSLFGRDRSGENVIDARLASGETTAGLTTDDSIMSISHPRGDEERLGRAHAPESSNSTAATISSNNEPSGGQRIPYDSITASQRLSGSVAAATSTAARQPPSESAWNVWRARDWLPTAARLILPSLFLAGAGASVAWLVFGQVLLARIRRSALPIESWLGELYESLPCSQDERPRLIVAGRGGRAMSWGVWRPTIVLPTDLCRPNNSDSLRHVLLHELGHVAQRDARGTLLFNLAFPLLYFHPLYWWLRSRVRLAGESIADDWAAAHSTRAAYAESLVVLARGRCRRVSLLGATGILDGPTQFYRRMHMLLERERPLTRSCSTRWRIACLTVSCLAVGLAGAVLGVQPAGAQTAQEDEKVRQLQAQRDVLEKRLADLQAKLESLEIALQQSRSDAVAAAQQVFVAPTTATVRVSVADPTAPVQSAATPVPAGGSLPATEPPTATDGAHVFAYEVRADDEKVFALDRASGKVVWSSKLGRAVKPPLWVKVAGEKVAVLDDDLRVIVIDGKTGRVISSDTQAGGKQGWEKAQYVRSVENARNTLTRGVTNRQPPESGKGGPTRADTAAGGGGQ